MNANIEIIAKKVRIMLQKAPKFLILCNASWQLGKKSFVNNILMITPIPPSTIEHFESQLSVNAIILSRMLAKSSR